jgi:hypothetical protein
MVAAPVIKVEHGVLDILEAGKHYTWDLRSPYVPIDVKGKPGRRSWEVQLGRPAGKPYVIDASVVDPREFMRVLTYYRRDL